MKKNNHLIHRMGAAFLSLSMALTPIATMPAVNVLAAAPVESESEKLEAIFTTLELMDATIPELTAAMESGELTAEALVQMYLDRIAAYDDSLDLNSIILINPDALETAKELDAERAAGNVRGSLHGIPIIVKDNYDVAGLPTSAGSKALENSIALKDSYAVKRLKEEGAIILAKANMSEFASSGAHSRSTLGGTVHNAYDTTRTAAGSSGGTGVAVTSNFCAAGLGTDTGSSIRRPSSFSNLYGLRPSKGLTSIAGIVPLNADRDVAGPICRTAEDLAYVLDAIAGTDTEEGFDEYTYYTVDADADSLMPADGYTSHLDANGLQGKKIGYLSNSFGYFVDNTGADLKEAGTAVEQLPVIQDMVKKALGNFEKGGAELVDASELIPETLIRELTSNAPYLNVFEWDLNNYLAALGDDAPCKVVKDILKTGYGVGYTNISVKLEDAADSLEEMENPRATESYPATWGGMTAFRTTISNIMEENDLDALVYVSQVELPYVEAETGSRSGNNSANYMNYFGPVAGMPDMMIPMGLAEADPESGYDHKLPLGISIVGAYGDEETLVEIAYGYEQTAGDEIREQPYTVPALPDENVNTFLEELMEKVDAIDYDDYTVYPKGKVSVMLSDYVDAAKTDLTDPEAAYEAAEELAESYDDVMEILSAHKKAEAPKKVTSVKAARTSDGSSAAVTFKAVKGADGYQVVYSKSKDFSKTKSVTTTSTSATLSKLTKTSTYYVKVRAFVNSEEGKVYGAYSSAKKMTAAPAAASITKATKSKTKASITVKKVSGADGYEFQYSTKKNFKSSKTVNTTKTTLSLSGLKSGKTYYVRARAYKTAEGTTLYGAYSKAAIMK